jgi:hypothetical protein
MIESEIEMRGYTYWRSFIICCPVKDSNGKRYNYFLEKKQGRFSCDWEKAEVFESEGEALEYINYSDDEYFKLNAYVLPYEKIEGQCIFIPNPDLFITRYDTND